MIIMPPTPDTDLLTSMPTLLPRAIYAALYWRPDGKYHWAIIIADDPTSGQKLHATNLESPAWQYACDDFGVATERKPLVVLGQMGVFGQHEALSGHVGRVHTRAASHHERLQGRLSRAKAAPVSPASCAMCHS